MNFLIQLEKKEPGIENGRCAYTVRECLDSGRTSFVLWCVRDSPATIREIPLLLFIFVLASLLEFLSFIAPWQFTFTHFSIAFTVSVFATNLLFPFVLLTPTISCHPASVLPTLCLLTFLGSYLLFADHHPLPLMPRLPDPVPISFAFSELTFPV